MLTTRVNDIRASATLAVDARAKELAAHGVDVINFAAGEPDFPTPEHIVEAAIAAARNPLSHKYSATPGIASLREAIAHDSNATAGSAIGSEGVLVANGAKQAIFQALAAIVSPGDEVLLPAPYWTTYPEVIAFFGGTTTPVLSASRPGRLPSVAELEAVATERTTALVWCSPSNPSGDVATAEHTRAVFTWAAERGLWIISDEIYRKLYYGTGRAATMRAVGLAEYPRLVVIDGVSKTYSMTGWRVGWIIAEPRFIAAASRLQGHLTSNVSNMAQAAALAALAGPQDQAADMLEAFRRRRAVVTEILREIPGVRLDEPDGAFYAFPDVREVLETRGLASSNELALQLLDEAHVAVVPGEAFGTPGYLRISYATADAQLIAGLRRIVQAVS